MDDPEIRNFFESMSNHILPTNNGGQFDLFMPLAASGNICNFDTIHMVIVEIFRIHTRNTNMKYIQVILDWELLICYDEVCM